MILNFCSHTRKLSITALFAVLTSCATTGERVSSDELSSLISGNTVYGTNAAGTSFIQFFAYNGSLLSGDAGSRDSQGKWLPEEKGQWKVVDGSLCNSYTSPLVHDAGCDKFYRKPDGSYGYVTSSGRHGSFDKIVSGRAE